MTRVALVLALLLAPALAGQSLTLKFADGKKKTLTVESFDDKGLTARAAGDELKIAWDELTAESAYAARKSLTPYDDGAKRRELSGFARSLRLYPDALEQLEIALALGGIDETDFEKEAASIEKEEIAYLTGHIDTLVMAKAKPDLQLTAIKKLKERYPDHEANKKYEPLIRALVEKLAAKAEADQSAKKKVSEDKALVRLRAAVDKLHEKKTKSLAKGDALHRAADRAIALRQVSRIKKSLVLPRGAEKYYRDARKQLRLIARTDKQFLLVKKADLEKEWDAIGQKMIDCNLKVARALMQQRNYKGAVKYVQAVLMLDPIHEEALTMRETIRKNRISFKMSDITNARPRVTGG